MDEKNIIVEKLETVIDELQCELYDIKAKDASMKSQVELRRIEADLNTNLAKIEAERDLQQLIYVASI